MSNIRGESLIKNNSYKFKAEEVKGMYINQAPATKFKISPKIANDDKGYRMYCYCTVFENANKLGLQSGDSISLGEIEQITFVRSKKNSSIYCYLTLSGITVHEGKPQEEPVEAVGRIAPTPPAAADAPPLPADEDAPPFDFDEDLELPFDL